MQSGWGKLMLEYVKWLFGVILYKGCASPFPLLCPIFCKVEGIAVVAMGGGLGFGNDLGGMSWC